MALISQSDVHMYEDFGAFEVDSGTTDTCSAGPSVEPLNSGVNDQDSLEDVAPASDQLHSRLPLPPRLRRPVISQMIWEGLKSIIQDLYIRQQLSLEEVRQRMKEQHNFDATEQMYKKRLRDWGVRKNYTQTQKLEAIKQLREAPSDTCGNLTLQVNGTSLKERRLWRPVMQKRNRVILAPRPSPASSTNARKRLGRFGHTPTPQHLQLQVGHQTQTIESLLRYAQSYHSWYQAQNQIKVQYGYTLRLQRVFDGLRSSIGLLHRGDSMAFCLINLSCSDFYALLQAQPFQLLPEIITLSGYRRLFPRKYEKVVESVLKFFASLAKTTLGMSHPIANFATILLEVDPEHFASCLRRYAELLLDQTKTVRNAMDSAGMQLAIIDLFEAAGQRDMASRLCRRLWKAVQPDPFVLTPVRTRLVEMVRLAVDEKDYSAVEQFLMQIISGSVVATGKQNGNTDSTLACHFLGWMYLRKGQLPKSEQFYRLAVDGALRIGGFSHSAILDMLNQYETILWKSGKEEELAQVRREYRGIWAPLDEWRLDHDLQGRTPLPGGLG
ncbi:Clr5 domain-containing protein [Cladophialophora immunda]|nr:Clr5 domain-containing protein [Cladophialophora immunda]